MSFDVAARRKKKTLQGKTSYFVNMFCVLHWFVKDSMEIVSIGQFDINMIFNFKLTVPIFKFSLIFVTSSKY